MKKGDIVIIAFVLVIAISLSFLTIFTKQTGLKELIIVQDGEIIHKYAFDDNFSKKIIIDDGDHVNTIEIKNGEIIMVEANCPDQVCVKSRPIRKNGEMIVCLPHRLYVKVISTNDNSDTDVDIIAS